VVKSVIRSLAPEVVVIDVSHEIAPHDVRAGGLTLARAAQYLAPGVVLAVVDPGVGTDRRPVAVEVGDAVSVLVGPDNGLLAPAVAMVGGATRAFVLDNAEFHFPAPGPTFAGRDVFAPVAAHLCNGVLLSELGTEIDPVTLLPGILPVTRIEDGGLATEVLWVDRFGNAQLNVDPDELDGWGDRIRLRTADQTRTARRVVTYDDLRAGEVGLVVDSYGLISVAVARDSAAAVLRIGAGSAVTLAPPDPGDASDGDQAGVVVDVELRRGNGR
jgi:S-adenosyl-L-methionine hydrolase (adenosine-forming)